ncbi:MAG: vWA domain-containing protein [Gemmataceae bacterium]
MSLTPLRIAWLLTTVFGAALGCSKPAETPLSIREVESKTENNRTIAPDINISRAAEFMGSRASGKRFCIIADASNSMRKGSFAQAKAEIMKTISSLDESSEFYVIFFNANAIRMPCSTWLSGGKESINKIRPWIQGVETALMTDPRPAFDIAFQLEPKPDAIFFMTDGFLHGKNPDPVTHVRRLNMSEPKVPIHTLMFDKANKVGKKSPAEAAAQLRRIATESGGTFRHVRD